MAWNRNSNVTRQQPQKRHGLSWVAFTALAVILGSVCLVVSWSSNEPTKQTDRRNRSIQTRQGVKSEKRDKTFSRADFKGYATGGANSEDEKKDSETLTEPKAATEKPVIIKRPLSLQEKVFTYPADHRIAELMMAEPGEEFVGETDDLYAGFKDDFLKAITEPIIIQNEDSDLVKQMKQYVKDTRQELMDRLNRGEDIEKVMRETRDELRQLGCYRNELMALVEEHCKNEDLSVEDVADFTRAANKMLEEKGAKPLEMPEVVIRQLKLNESNIEGEVNNEN